MKKGLFYLLLLLAGSFAFTSCSDDDDPNWQKLPEEVTGENLDIRVNGAPAGGTVTFKAQSGEAAVLELKQIIPGCDVVEMNVEMAEQENGSFNFSGSKEVEGVEVRSEATVTKNKYEVGATGNVTIEGKLKADLTITLLTASLNGRTYAGQTLHLSYSGAGLAGKRVNLQTANGLMANLALVGILPGEPDAVLSDVMLDVNGYQCDFSGTATMTSGTKVGYTGTVLGDTLTLNLDVTLGSDMQGGLAGTWDLLDTTLYNSDLSAVLNAPLYIHWESTWEKAGSGINPAEQLSLMGSAMGSHVIFDVLRNVTFGKDGNVTARYFSTDLFSKSMEEIIGFLMSDDFVIPVDRVWASSPKNLAFWYTENDKLYIIPDIAMILKQVKEDGGNVDLGGLDINNLLQGLQDMSGEEIKQLLENFLIQYNIPLDLSSIDAATVKEVAGWLSSGIPLNYKIGTSGLEIRVDKEMVAPFMPLVLSLLPMLQDQMNQMAQQPGNEFIGLLPFILGIDQLTDFNNVWAETSAFELGLGFSGK